MTTLADLKSFDLQKSDVTIWVFRRSRSNSRHPYAGRWIGISEALAAKLRESVSTSVSGISEILEYDILAQNNEASALTIEIDETDAHLIASQATEPTLDLKVRSVKDLENSDFCVARFSYDGNTILAIRKTDSSWSTRKTNGLISMVFTDNELDLDNQPVFTVRPNFDFFIMSDRIFILSKPHFESLLAYKAGHQKVFEELTAEIEFAAIFADTRPIAEFVGTNKIHLRRAVAVQQKGHYKDPGFMARLRAECGNMNLKIAFDDDGRIIATVESGRDIFQALLDHRLESRLTARMYDVPSTEQVC